MAGSPMSIGVDVSAQLYGLPPQGHPVLTMLSMLTERKHKAKCGAHMQRNIMLMFSNSNNLHVYQERNHAPLAPSQ